MKTVEFPRNKTAPRFGTVCFIAIAGAIAATAMIFCSAHAHGQTTQPAKPTIMFYLGFAGTSADEALRGINGADRADYWDTRRAECEAAIRWAGGVDRVAFFIHMPGGAIKADPVTGKGLPYEFDAMLQCREPRAPGEPVNQALRDYANGIPFFEAWLVGRVGARRVVVYEGSFYGRLSAMRLDAAHRRIREVFNAHYNAGVRRLAIDMLGVAKTNTRDRWQLDLLEWMQGRGMEVGVEPLTVGLWRGVFLVTGAWPERKLLVGGDGRPRYGEVIRLLNSEYDRSPRDPAPLLRAVRDCLSRGDTPCVRLGYVSPMSYAQVVGGEYLD